MSKGTNNGLVYKDGELVYCENGVPKHAGVVKIDNDIYYAGHSGKLAVGEKIVHGSMTNGLLERGTYRFDESGKLIEGSYIAPVKRKKSKKRFKKRLSSRHRNLIIISAAVVVAAAALFVGLTVGRNAAHSDSGVSQSDMILSQVSLPSFDEELYLCPEAVKGYSKGELSLEEALEMLKDDASYTPFVFSYSLPDGVTASLQLDSKTYDLNPFKSSISIDNLMTGRTYRYTVTVTYQVDSQDKTASYEGSFTTAATNRLIYLPGVLNTRDIGGYMTSFEKRVRQGQLIRGSEIDGLVNSDFFLTDVSAAEPFGFRYDFDLREDTVFAGDFTSRLGENVKHSFYSSPMYGGIFSDDSRSTMKRIFTDLANPENYPMYLHCTYGEDRTGTIIFLLQGLLGVSEEDMKLEYCLSGLQAERLNGIYSGLENFDGDTVQERIENYLVDYIGITYSQIESIRSILLED